MKKPKTTATASLRLEVEKLAQKGIEVVAIEAEVMTDGLALRKKVVRKKDIPPVGGKIPPPVGGEVPPVGGKISPSWGNLEFPDMLDSKIVPGLIFILTKDLIIYEDRGWREKPPRRSVFRLLYGLERFGGKAGRDEVIDECWPQGGTAKALERAIGYTITFLKDIGVPKSVSEIDGVVIWD